MTQRVRLLGLRSVAAFGVLVSGIAAGQSEPADPVGPGPGEIVLDIRNETDAPIRCVVVLAHFITRDVEAVAPGETLGVILTRDMATGTLAYGEHAGRPMFVENVLCGSVADWDGGHADMVLDALRLSPATLYRATCRVEDAFACAIVEETTSD